MDANGKRSTAVLAASAALFASSAAASETSQSAIVVTGERASRTLLETPSSVTVVNHDDLETHAGADRLDQILTGIPNVQLGSGGEGPTIRGQDSTGVLRDLPAFLGGTRPRVTLQVDGRPISYNELAFGISGLWDLAQIEVFRSPQTTTQGRNAIAGAIFIETQDPTFDWQGRLRMAAGNYAARQASAAVSGPLIADQLALRIAGDIRRNNTTTSMTSAASGADANRDKYELLRVKLVARPIGIPSLKLTGTYTHTSSVTPQIEGLRPPYRARRDGTATYGIFSTNVDSLTLRADYPLTDGLTAKATGWLGAAHIRRFAPPGFGESDNDASDRGGELILTARPSTGLTVTLGTNVLQTGLRQKIDLTAASLGTARFDDRQRSIGLFGELRADFAARWEITAGGRYQRDSQRRTGTLQIRGSRLPYTFDRSFSRFLPKASLSYSPASDARIGLTVQRAYNPGGATINLGTFANDEFEAETLWAYELFARTELADGRLRLSANVFHYDIRDAQRAVSQAMETPGGVVTFAEIGNAPAAWSRGAEIELRWHPEPTLSVNAAIGLQRTKLTRTPSLRDPLLGKEFQRAPHFTGSLQVDWRPSPPVRLSAQVRHNAGYFSDDANDPLRRVAASTTLDARAEWSWRSLAIAAYVRNLLDEFHLTYVFSAPSQLATAGEPRKVGIEVTARF